MAVSTKPKSRTRARRYLLQALYEWQLSGNDPKDVEAHHLEQNDPDKFDTDFFHDGLFYITENTSTIDNTFTPFIDDEVVELTPIEQAILRIGTYELLQRPEVPTKVIINEAIELAKAFAKEKSHTFVNAVLDKTAKQVREV